MSVADNIAACIDELGIEFVLVQGPAMSGKTSLVIQLARSEAEAGRPVAIMSPTKDLARQRQAAMRDRERVDQIHFLGSNSLTSRPFRTVFADDADRFDARKGEGSPLMLAQQKSATFHAGKVIAFSSARMPEWMRQRPHRQFVLQ